MYVTIAKKWINNTITNDEVAIFKQKVYSLLPDWIDEKINVINAPDDINYIIITQNGKNCIWLYNNNVFEVKNESHIEFLPSCFVIEESYTTTVKGYTITIAFAKYTGLAFLHCKVTLDGRPNDDLWVDNEAFFKSNDCYNKSKIYMNQLSSWSKTTNNYDDNIEHAFITDDKFYMRYNDWYDHNKYKEYEKLGIESDYSTTLESQWVNSDEDTIIEKFDADELISFDDFTKLVSSYFNKLFTHSEYRDACNLWAQL